MRRIDVIKESVFNILNEAGFQRDERVIRSTFKAAERSGTPISPGTPEARTILVARARQTGSELPTGSGKMAPAGNVSRIPYVPADGKPRKAVTGWDPKETITTAYKLGIDSGSIKDQGGIMASQHAQQHFLDPKTQVEPPRKGNLPSPAGRSSFVKSTETPRSSKLDVAISERQPGDVMRSRGGVLSVRKPVPVSPPPAQSRMQKIGGAISQFIRST